MQNLILSALETTYAYSGWSFSNESEFKHELFHQLALLKHKGVPLAQTEAGALTPRLHAEGKVQNGNPAKADLLVCDPFVFQGFNYKVDHVIELKVSLTAKALKDEIGKLNSYQRRISGIWLISLNPLRIPTEGIPKEHPAAESLRVIGPTGIGDATPEIHRDQEAPSLSEVVLIVGRCVDKCLNLYGNGKGQFQSHFWCNFEHELERRHSFPCEGDFNAQLYHCLRINLPASLRIYSEYSPQSLSRRRIDFLIKAPGGEWAIPIEVKMNWDQFKPKYKNRAPIRSEALTILDRFSAVKEEMIRISPILVVIQGEWRRATKMPNKENALRDLETAAFPFELACYDESLNTIVRKNYDH